MQIVWNDQTVRGNTVQEWKDFNSTSLATQAKKEEKLVSRCQRLKNSFDLIGGDIVDLSTEN